MKQGHTKDIVRQNVQRQVQDGVPVTSAIVKAFQHAVRSSVEPLHKSAGREEPNLTVPLDK